MLLLLLGGHHRLGGLLLLLGRLDHHDHFLEARIDGAQLGVHVHFYTRVVQVVLMEEQAVEQGDNLPAHVRNVDAAPVATRRVGAGSLTEQLQRSMPRFEHSLFSALQRDTSMAVIT